MSPIRRGSSSAGPSKASIEQFSTEPARWPHARKRPAQPQSRPQSYALATLRRREVLQGDLFLVRGNPTLSHNNCATSRTCFAGFPQRGGRASLPRRDGRCDTVDTFRERPGHCAQPSPATDQAAGPAFHRRCRCARVIRAVRMIARHILAEGRARGAGPWPWLRGRVSMAHSRIRGLEAGCAVCLLLLPSRPFL